MGCPNGFFQAHLLQHLGFPHPNVELRAIDGNRILEDDGRGLLLGAVLLPISRDSV